MATGVPVWEIEPALGLLVGGLLAAGIYPVIRRMGSRAEQGKNVLKEANRSLGDSFQVIPAITNWHLRFAFQQNECILGTLDLPGR